MGVKIDISKSMIDIGIVKFRKWHKRKFSHLDELSADDRFVALGGKLSKIKVEKEDDV